MICPSPPLRALTRPTPPLARLKGRALVGRDFIVSDALRAWLGNEKRGRGDRALISDHPEAANFGAGEVLRVSTGFPVSNTGKRHHGRFAGRGDRAGLDDLRRDMARQIHLIVQNPYYVDHVAL